MLVSPLVDAAAAGVLGLIVGSFLNVVIHRTPLMMARQWWGELAGLLTDGDAYRKAFGTQPPQSTLAEGARLQSSVDALPPLSLARPGSRCPHCGHAIAWWENVPVLSYIFLRGKCSGCATRISLRYPLVEIATAAAFAIMASRWGITWQAASWAVCCAILIALFLIDFDTQLLPDDLTLPLLWLGLVAAALGWTVPLSEAMWGAVAGYLSLWLVYHGFKLATGKEGMGYGDFKLFAALGAWFGAHYLVALILLSSVVGSIVGGGLLVVGRIAHKDIPIAFGPFIAGAGLVAIALGPQRLAGLIPFAFPFGG
jgi:leader peptidase (prepilin peptidase) / N-methyltransferase